MKLQILTKLKELRTNWKYALIIVVLTFVVGGGILSWWWRKEESKISEEKVVKEEKFEKIISDSRILLDQEKWEKLIYGEEIGKEFNLEPPNTTVLYSNPAKGISLQIPYNQKWGTEKYKIPPYYEYDEYVLFGPIFIFEAGSVERACSIRFLPPRDAEEVMTSLEEIAIEGKGLTEGILKETITKEIINGLTVIKYIDYDTLLGEVPEIIVIGKKYNYKFSCFYAYSIEEIKVMYEKMIETLQFVSSDF